MKHTKDAFLAFVTCAAMVALTGCGDSKQVTDVKALPFSYPNAYTQDPNMTVEQALSNRTICDTAKWSTTQDDHNRAVVEYDCNYKGVSDSATLARDKTDTSSAGDVYQWTYGADGRPVLTAVAFVIRYNNGSSKNFGIDPTALMRFAVDNKATNFDEAWSSFYNAPIPQKPATPITDTTYGNKLTELYPNDTPLKATQNAYLWKNAPLSLQTYGLDSLGYLKLENSSEAESVAFPVDPANVQITWKVDPSTINTVAGPDAVDMPKDLQENKLFCLNNKCYDKEVGYVGKAPPEVLAKETPAPAYYGKGVGSQLTTNTPGNAIGLFMPGKTPLQAIQDALAMIHSTLTVTNADSLGYPIYQVKCVGVGDQCIDGAGRSMGAQADVAKQMFPVNGSDIGISCSTGLLCTDSFGNVVGRGYTGWAAQVLVQQSAQQDGNAQQPATPGQAVAQAIQPEAPAGASTADPVPVGAEDWPTPTPCIKKLEDAYRKDHQAHGLDDAISMDQANDFASTCKALGQ